MPLKACYFCFSFRGTVKVNCKKKTTCAGKNNKVDVDKHSQCSSWDTKGLFQCVRSTKLELSLPHISK